MPRNWRDNDVITGDHGIGSPVPKKLLETLDTYFSYSKTLNELIHFNFV